MPSILSVWVFHIHRWPLKNTKSVLSGSFVGREMAASNCDVSSESCRRRFGFLSPSPRGHTVMQVISQSFNALWICLSYPPLPLSSFLHHHFFSSCRLFLSFLLVLLHSCSAVPVSWLWLTSAQLSVHHVSQCLQTE